MSSAVFEDHVRRVRPDVAGVRLTPVGQDRARSDDDYSVAVLIAAMSAAAAAGADAATVGLDRPLAERKASIDGAATRAAEHVFARSAVTVNVVAGEGPRDDSPGAFTGQMLGARAGTAESATWDGIFDYVDGTTLVAKGLPGALALGAIGTRVRPVPDLQAFTIMAPVDVLDQFDVMATPEEYARDALDIVATRLGRRVDDLVVLTHSLGSGGLHADLIGRLRRLVREVIVPDPVIIEPQQMLSLIGLSQPRIDAMIGGIGLSELVFAAAMLDLVRPDYGFAFRMGSIDGPRSSAAPELSPMFRFSPDEIDDLRALRWETDRGYTGADLVPVGSARAAAIFGVTAGGPLGLAAPTRSGSERFTDGYLLEPGGVVSRVTVRDVR